MSMPAKGKHHHLSHHHQQQQHHPHQQQQQAHHQQQQQQAHQQHHQQQQQQQQQHQQQQPQQQHVANVNVNPSGIGNAPQQQQQQAYNAVVAANASRYVSHAGSDFHVPGQNYVAQPGGHVGGGGGSVGVPGGRGPPSLGGIQSIGQTPAGIQQGGPPSGQQQPPQAPTPGVQQQQSQGPAPTTTPPVHTPSPQEMGKQAHLQTQPPLQQVYVPNQTRPVSQNYFPTGPRQQPPRGLGHRSGQGNSGTQVVGMSGVGGGGGQPTAMYPHQGIPVPPGTTMYLPGQVPGLHQGPPQQAIYPMNTIMPLFQTTPQRHQTHQGQSFFQSYTPHAIVASQNMFPFGPGQGPQHPYFYQQAAAPINISRASANAVSGGAQHVGGPLAGAQGAGGVPQGTLQQPSPQPQPIPSMAIPLPQTEVYTGHNGGTSNASSNSGRAAKPIRKNALMDIVNPETGKNVAGDIYGALSGTSSNRETPQPQNPELVAEFAARVAKAASEGSDSGSPAPSTVASNVGAGVASAVTASTAVSSVTPEHTSSQSSSGQSVTNLKIQTNSSKDPPGQCNTGPPTPTQNAANVVPAIGAQQQQQQLPQQQQQTQSSSSVQTLNSSSTVAPAQQIDNCPIIKTESKPLQFPAQEFWPRGEIKPASPIIDEQQPQQQHHVVIPPVAVKLENKDTTVTAAQPEVTVATAAAVVPPVAASSPAPMISEQPEPAKTVAAVVASSPCVPQAANVTPATSTSPVSTHVPETPNHPSSTAAPAMNTLVSAVAATATAVASLTATVAAAAAAATTTPVTPVAPVTATGPVSSFPGPLPTRPRHMYSGPSIDSFPTLTSKSSSSSPPRRKTHHHQQQQQQSQAPAAPAPVVTPAAPAAGPTVASVVADLPPSGKDQQKERKISDRSTGASRGTTPTPSHHNQTTGEQHHQRSNGETASEKSDGAPEPPLKVDHHHQKSGDGKAMQKHKNKSKLKHKDLNRKGQEKEGTDMDAFVNPATASKPEGKTQQQTQQDANKGQAAQIPPTGKETSVTDSSNVRDIAKGIKERENNEMKIESSEVESAKTQKGKNLSKPEISKEVSVASIPPLIPTTPVQPQVVDEQSQQEATATIQQNHNETVSKESSTPMIEDSSESNQGVCNMPTKTLPNDVVDHAKVIVKDEIDVEAIVAQKNEENAKVSALHASTNENATSETPVIKKENENEPPSQIDTIPTAPPPLKYIYKDDQWSPRNVTGKKEYDRDFLMKLQDDPKSRIRPPHLPEMDVVLKDCIKSRSTEFRAFKDPPPNRHDALYPGFAKSGYTQKAPLLTKKSYQGKTKTNKPNQIHLSLSLREDVKLREAENAWRPTCLKATDAAEENIKTEALYKKVRSVLNKLTPQKFDTLVSQVRALEIDTREKLQGVIDLVFEKAVDEPNFSVAYALMCKELAQIKVLTDERKAEIQNEERNRENSKEQRPQPTVPSTLGEVNFRKLIVDRCQMHFQKNNTIDEGARNIKLKEIEACTDPEKKKELQVNLEEDDRRLRVRSVGNIRFIGELFKREVLSTKVMHICIAHLLSNPDEENLECLCKLLTTIGKVLEAKAKPEYSIEQYFTQLSGFGNKKNQRKISSRIRFMIQDVIDLRARAWIPRRDENKPKTMDQIQKEAECERSEVPLNSTPMNTPRKDDRNNDRRRNRGGGGSSGMEEGGWSAPVGKTSRTPYSVETSKLSLKAPPPDETRFGNRNMFVWGAVATSKTLTPNKYALLENIPSDVDKRPQLQVSGSRSTGPKDFGRREYKPWESKPPRLDGHQMNSGSSGARSMMEAGRSQSITMPMKIKPQQPITSSSSSTIGTTFSSSSSKPQKTEAELKRITTSIMDSSLCEPNTDLFIKNAMEQLQDHFDTSTYPQFVREAINGALEKNTTVRHQCSALFGHLVNHNIIPLSLIQSEFEKVLEVADDLVIDIPKIWTYFAELLSNMVVKNAHPLAEIKTTVAILKSLGTGGKLIGELLAKLAREQGPKWVEEKWDQSGLQWNDVIDTGMENVDDIISRYKLEFLSGECKSSDITSSGSQLTNDQIHDYLVKLMRESNFDNICSWISANVGSRVKESYFIRILMTAILDVTVEERHNVWKLNEKSFKNLQTLIKRYIANADADLELQCLFAIQAYVHKLEHPPGLIFNILTSLHQNDILSDEAFLTWESNQAELPGHAVAIKGLNSFFTGLREPDSDEA